MNGKAAARVLACLVVIAGLVLTASTQARADASTGLRPGLPSGAPAVSAAPDGTIYINQNYVDTGIKQLQEMLQEVAEADEKKNALDGEHDSLTQRIDADNARSADLENEGSALSSKADSIVSETQTLNAEIAAHNNAPHTFEIPQQEAAAEAYGQQAAELRAEQSGLNAQRDTVSAELSRVAGEADQLASEEEALDADIATYNDQVAALNASLAQLAAQAQQLFEQEAAAEQDAIASPPDPAAAMNAGADTSSPPQQVGQAANQGTGSPGGDAPSQEPQIAAVKQFASRTGATVSAEPGVAVLTPSAISRLPAAQAAHLGSPVMTFDGLAREPNGDFEALEVRTPGEAVSAQQRAFESAIRRGGQATTTVGGRPSVINKLLFATSRHFADFPSKGRTPSPPGEGKAACLTERPSNNGVGWIENTEEPVPHTNIQVTPLGPPGFRSGRGTACLTSVRGPGSTAKGDITGWQDASETVLKAGLDPQKVLARCHIIANALGGQGTPGHGDNLFPCYQAGTNTGSPSMRTPFETVVVEAANTATPQSGDAVYYVVTPLYENADSTIPSRVLMSAEIQTPDGGSEPIFVDVLANASNNGFPGIAN